MKNKTIQSKTKNPFLWMWNQIKRVPWYGWVFGPLILGFNTLFYFGAEKIIDVWTHEWMFQPILKGFDDAIPFIPYFFAQVYFAWNILIVFGGIIGAVVPRKDYINLYLAWISSMIIGFLIMAFIPSYMDRTHCAGVGNLLEVIKNGHGYSYDICRMYTGGGTIVNNTCEFPSFHCLQIIFCGYAICGRKEIKVGYRLFWLFWVISICLSTVFIKQHYIIDVFMSIMLCTGMYFIFKFLDFGGRILNKKPNFLIIEKINWTNEPIVAKNTRIINKKKK